MDSLMREKASLTDYAFAAAVVAGCTAACHVLVHVFDPANLVMVYLLGVLAVAARGRTGPAALASVMGVLCFDYFFIHPVFTLRVSDVQYLWTLVVMFITAMAISRLAVGLRRQAGAARQAELDAAAERTRSALLSLVSHDFRTPLAAILGSADTLLAKGPGASEREQLENIRSEADRLSRLVQKLLEVTRLESGAVRVRKELFPLEDVMGGALERFEKSAEGRKVSVDIPEDLPPVPMDGALVEQAITNLLENAARHGGVHGAISIAARRQEGSVRVSVADRGPGVRAEDMERVFEKFYKGPSSPGAGLGLAICRAVVEAHGGRIWAEARPEGGAVFLFTLPLGGGDGR